MNYRMHDLSAFPFVALVSDRCVPGYAEQWGMEMDALLDSGKMFVVAYHQDTLNETAEDFRTRGIWFKKNRARLAGHCAAMVAIVPSEDQRQAFAVDMEKRSRGFGVRYCALESFDAARSATARFVQDVADKPGTLARLPAESVGVS
ncbi:hypothetical protein [Pseudomonas shirazensis]|uniref:hypothetical protein n=1 Tax=Pseudomonas shirazensis TaxID=2745494 RepID=UPI003D290F87